MTPLSPGKIESRQSHLFARAVAPFHQSLIDRKVADHQSTLVEVQDANHISACRMRRRLVDIGRCYSRHSCFDAGIDEVPSTIITPVRFCSLIEKVRETIRGEK
jgi:hypothetical protein